LKKGTGRTVIEQNVFAIRKPLLASRTLTWQALLHALAIRAVSSQYFSMELAEGIKRGSSKRKERERTQSTLYEPQGMPCRYCAYLPSPR